ncbi:hypothetical protein [Pseudaestuariivita rosea]|uniref:hypothetical protein n=1 Tax=Pseudaestuariivita rosea TaxID=2763263 RepID=UPI001ABA3DAE|nr:hypothetical protein [Pseudaestuariivita rosea]
MVDAVAKYPFDPDLKEPLLEEIDDMGTDFAIGTLDAVLMEAAGGIVAEGVTKEMYEGQVISAMIAADMIAVSLGEAATVLDEDFQKATAPHAEDLRETEGAADLADRALAIVSDENSETYADCSAELSSRDEFLKLVGQLRGKLTDAKTRYAGTWEDAPAGALFEITMYPEDGDTK